jgi:hypothetical protein
MSISGLVSQTTRATASTGVSELWTLVVIQLDGKVERRVLGGAPPPGRPPSGFEEAVTLPNLVVYKNKNQIFDDGLVKWQIWVRNT